PPEQVSRVKKHPALLQILEMWVHDQVNQITAEIAELTSGRDLALEEWHRLRGTSRTPRALVPRLAGFASWVKKAELESSQRIALEGLVKRWKKRADDCVLDWAELLTDPAVLARGFAAFFGSGGSG